VHEVLVDQVAVELDRGHERRVGDDERPPQVAVRDEAVVGEQALDGRVGEDVACAVLARVAYDAAIEDLAQAPFVLERRDGDLRIDLPRLASMPRRRAWRAAAPPRKNWSTSALLSEMPGRLNQRSESSMTITGS